MKLAELKRNVDAAYKKLGNIECYLDIDPEEDEIYEVEGIFLDQSRENDAINGLVFAAYSVVPTLTVVK